MTSPLLGPPGEQRPRVHKAPPRLSSAGTEAVELAASAGLILDPWQCFALEEMLGERADGKWAAFECALIVARQNGKGSILEALEIAGLFLFGERLIIHSAHEYKTAAEHFLRVKLLIDNTDDLRRQVKAVRTSHGEEGIELLNGNRLRFLARSKGSGRGFSCDRLVLDEAMILGAEQMAATLPTLSSRPNPQVVYAASAGMVDSAQLNSVRARVVDGNGNVIPGQPPGLCYLEWSAPENADPADPREQAKANPALGGRIPHEFVALEQATMPPAEFARERLSIWSEERHEAPIPLAAWLALADHNSTPIDPVTFGIDVSVDHSTAAISVAGMRADGLQHLEVVEIRNGTRWVVDRCVELRNRWGHDVLFVLDPGSAAGGLIPMLEDAGLELLLTSSRQLAQACSAFYDGVVEGTVRHILQAEMTEALTGARKRPLGDAWAWARKDNANIAPLVALTLAKFGLDSRPPIDITESIW